jgi:hypothetical protein
MGGNGEMRKRRWVVLAWVSTVILLGACLVPKAWLPRREESPGLIPHTDKVVHFALFAAFGFCWAKAGTSGRLTASRAARVLAAAAALAVGTELAQGLDAIQRDPDPLDALADGLGGAFGVGVVAISPRPGRPDRDEGAT